MKARRSLPNELLAEIAGALPFNYKFTRREYGKQKDWQWAPVSTLDQCILRVLKKVLVLMEGGVWHLLMVVTWKKFDNPPPPQSRASTKSKKKKISSFVLFLEIFVTFCLKWFLEHFSPNNGLFCPFCQKPFFVSESFYNFGRGVMNSHQLPQIDGERRFILV